MRTIRYKDLGQNNLEQLKQELRVNVKSELPRTGGTGVLLNLGLRVMLFSLNLGLNYPEQVPSVWGCVLMLNTLNIGLN